MTSDESRMTRRRSYFDEVWAREIYTGGCLQSGQRAASEVLAGL